MILRAALCTLLVAAAGCSESVVRGDEDASLPDQGSIVVDRAVTDRGRAEGSPLGDGHRPDGGKRDGAAGCGEYTGFTRMTCSKDGNSRGKCTAGTLTAESCARGCLRQTAPADDVCMGTTTSWSCTGTQGTQKAQDGDYYLTSFGCWTDSSGTKHTDPGDNCIPGCLSKAQTGGLCASLTGPQCEEKLNYYTADNGRFPCLSRLRITNPKNGKAVIAVVLDGGPACWVEQNASKAILDASVPIANHLFGTSLGWSDKAVVHVVEVDSSTPLGPLP